MITLASLLLAQLVLPNGEGMSAEQRVAVLCQSVTAKSTSLLILFGDAGVRTEMERVGVEAGCPVAKQIARTAAERFRDALAPYAETAVRETIPAERLEQFRPVSFLAGGAVAYQSRVDQKFEQVAAEPLAHARHEARTELVASLARLPDFVPEPNAKPAIDPFFESAFGASAGQTFESAALLSLACLQRQVPSGLTIEHAGQTFPSSGDSE